MNHDTAMHLNALLARATKKLAIGLQGANCPGMEVSGGTTKERQHMDDYIEGLRVLIEPQAIEEEIQAAARERRRADTYTGGPGESLIFWGQVNGHNNGAGGVALRLAMPRILAEIQRLNDKAEADYENYRLACEQGVAVPPATPASDSK